MIYGGWEDGGLTPPEHCGVLSSVVERPPFWVSYIMFSPTSNHELVFVQNELKIGIQRAKLPLIECLSHL